MSEPAADRTTGTARYFWPSSFVIVTGRRHARSRAWSVGSYSIVGGELTIGTLLAFWQLVERFFAPIQDLSEKYNIMQAAMASSERVFRLMDTAPTFVDPRSRATSRKCPTRCASTT